ncbi:MAG: 50S ribosomal protein L24 [Candidatus Paceibacterota bacterium]|jgi:large subunit ribosomal protein L24
MHVKKGDKVIVLAGKDKGATGEVVRSFPKLGKVVVSGVNKVKKHQRPTRSGQKGQIIEKEMPLNASNVKLATASKK